MSIPLPPPSPPRPDGVPTPAANSAPLFLLLRTDAHTRQRRRASLGASLMLQSLAAVALLLFAHWSDPGVRWDTRSQRSLEVTPLYLAITPEHRRALPPPRLPRREHGPARPQPPLATPRRAVPTLPSALPRTVAAPRPSVAPPIALTPTAPPPPVARLVLPPPVPAVRVGAFADPGASRAHPQPTAARTGLFANEAGTIAGTAAGIAGAGTVHTGNFSSGAALASRSGPERLSVGAFNASPPPALAASAASKPVPVRWSPPRILSRPQPLYTAAAQQARVEGDVVLEARLQATGRVQILRLISGLGYGLDQSARRAAEQVRFQPARRNGEPVDWTVLLHVHFHLAE